MKTSATSTPSPVPAKALKSSKDASPALGTLWTMRRSPFSTAVKVVVHLSGRRVDEVPFVPLLSYFSLLFRLGLSAFRTKLTAPILKTRGRASRYIRDSLSIAVYVDGERDTSRPSLFPPEHMGSIARFSEGAGVLNSFMRAALVSKLKEDTEAAEIMFMPRALRGRFFSKALVKIGVWVFARKYAKESKEASREVVREVLEETRKALASYEGKHLRYVCGERLTYADVIMAESLFFDTERHGRLAYLYKDEEFADRFPDLIAWARAVRETHYPELMAARKTRQ